jgi:hypothetical protein
MSTKTCTSLFIGSGQSQYIYTHNYVDPPVRLCDERCVGLAVARHREAATVGCFDSSRHEIHKEYRAVLLGHVDTESTGISAATTLRPHNSIRNCARYEPLSVLLLFSFLKSHLTPAAVSGMPAKSHDVQRAIVMGWFGNKLYIIIKN